MKPKDLLFPFILIPLGIAFFTIALLLFLSNGENKKLISAKLKIGALLLSFGWLASCEIGTTTCYAPAPNNLLNINTDSTYAAGDTLRDNLIGGSYKFYSFILSEQQSALSKQEGRLIPNDGSFGDNSESFYFVLDKSIPEGVYWLDVYGGDTDLLETQNHIRRYPFNISK